MIVAEYHQSEHFDEIENELVNRLDSLFMSDSKGDDISRAFFIGQLRHLFDSSDVDERLRERVAEFPRFCRFVPRALTKCSGFARKAEGIR